MINEALMCLALTMYQEARGEPLTGQVAVGYVLYRRADFDPDKVCYEMKKPYQFSWYGKVPNPTYTQLQPYVALASEIVYHKREDTSMGATHFHNFTVNPKWNMKPRVIIQNHIFY
jgi:spore germination cell wall hydrolase CwlJ-like protein